MIYPTIKDLNKENDYNRYEIALATAKCARMITNEYTRQRAEAERATIENKEGDKPYINYIDREMRDEKAVKLAIARINDGEYTIIHKNPVLQEEEEAAFLSSINRPLPIRYDAHSFMMGESDEFAAEDDAADETHEAAADSESAESAESVESADSAETVESAEGASDDLD